MFLGLWLGIANTCLWTRMDAKPNKLEAYGPLDGIDRRLLKPVTATSGKGKADGSTREACP